MYIYIHTHVCVQDLFLGGKDVSIRVIARGYLSLSRIGALPASRGGDAEELRRDAPSARCPQIAENGI